MPNKAGRPRNLHETVEVKITSTEKFGAYLDDLVKEQGYGNSRAEVARLLTWRGIQQLITDRLLKRRK